VHDADRQHQELMLVLLLLQQPLLAAVLLLLLLLRQQLWLHLLAVVQSHDCRLAFRHPAVY
jgi:hypothetical protein